jgi:hypothetical protein
MAAGGRCGLHGEADILEAVGPDQRIIGVADLVGVTVEEVQNVELQAQPSAVR